MGKKKVIGYSLPAENLALIGVRETPVIIEDLDYIANREGSSRSALLRHIIRDFIGKYKKEFMRNGKR